MNNQHSFETTAIEENEEEFDGHFMGSEMFDGTLMHAIRTVIKE
jgi:hypothetical protein